MKKTNAQTILLDYQAVEHLKITSRWTNFLSITAFALIVLISAFVIGYFVYSSVGEGKNSLIAILPMVLILVIYFFPVYYLFQFSTFSKYAIEDNDHLALVNALKYLKMHYRYMGVLTICLFCLYFVLGIVVITSGKFVHLLS